MSTISSGISQYASIFQVAFKHYNGTFQQLLRQHSGPDNLSMHLAWHWRVTFTLGLLVEGCVDVYGICRACSTGQRSTSEEVTHSVYCIPWLEVNGIPQALPGHFRLFQTNTHTHTKTCSVIAPCSWPYIVYTWWISLIMHAHYSWGT